MLTEISCQSPMRSHGALIGIDGVSMSRGSYCDKSEHSKQVLPNGEALTAQVSNTVGKPRAQSWAVQSSNGGWASGALFLLPSSCYVAEFLYSGSY